MLATGTIADEPARPASVSYHKEIRPILQQKCQGCHQPARLKGDLLLVSYDGFAKGGRGGVPFVPGKPEESLVVKYLKGLDGLNVMPEGEPPLPKEQIELFERWIQEGAKDDTPEQFKRTIVSKDPPKYAHPIPITAMAFTPDGSALAVAGYREILLLKPDGSERLGRLLGLSERVETLVFSPDGDTLLVVGGSAGRFGELQFWDWKNQKLSRSVMPSYDTVYGASYSPDGSKISIGCADNSIRLLDAKTGKEIRRIDQHQDWVFGTALSLDGKFLITCSRDRSVKLFETDTGSFIDNITTITPGLIGGGLRCLTRRPGKDEYLTAGEDGIPKLYRKDRPSARVIGDDANLIRNYEKLPGRVECLGFSADGKFLAAGGTGGTVRVYQAEDAKIVANLPAPTSVFCLSFAPDNSRIAIAGFDGKVRAFSLPDGKPAAEFVPVPIEPKAK
jgi:WD40 repeat protein